MMDATTLCHERERGQAMVEFALTVTLLVFLLLGSLDFGRAVYARSALANAAREGARYGILDPTNSTMIQSTALAAVPALTATVTSRCSPDCLPNSSLAVTATTAFQPISFFFPSLTLRGVSIMTIE